MSIGDRIRFFRKWNDLTQRELGLKLGFSENTADVRIAQYESNQKTPRPDMLSAIAETLGVTVDALVAPDISSNDRIMQTLFLLEDELGFFIDKEGKNFCLGLNSNHPKYETMKELLAIWHEAYQKLIKSEDNRIEYNRWRYRYPSYIAPVNEEAYLAGLKRKKEIESWQYWVKCIQQPEEGVFSADSMYLAKMISGSNPQTYHDELIDEGFLVLDAVNETFHYSMRDFSAYFKIE